VTRFEKVDAEFHRATIIHSKKRCNLLLSLTPFLSLWHSFVRTNPHIEMLLSHV